jgi:hypothetical protein
MIHGGFIERDELFERSVRIGERLKIDDKFIGFKAIPQVLDPIMHLVFNRFQPAGTPGTERIIIAVYAASHARAAVSIGAAESSIDAHFVDTASKLFL